IFYKILHLAIDYLIGNTNDKKTLRSSHKYGFQNADEFLLVTRKMSSYYKDFSLVKTENITPFSSFSPEMNRLVPIVLAARQLELSKYLEQYEYSKTENIIESFEWDTRLILGDSSFGGNIHQITILKLSFSHLNPQNRLIFEMSNGKLNDLIYLMEEFLAQ
ncbi:hypothetical protein KR084_012240, partial [Drosophila pseudotakahashii]